MLIVNCVARGIRRVQGEYNVRALSNFRPMVLIGKVGKIILPIVNMYLTKFYILF